MNTRLSSENIGDRITENYNRHINDRPTAAELEKMEHSYLRMERNRMIWKCVKWGVAIIVAFVLLSIALA